MTYNADMIMEIEQDLGARSMYSIYKEDRYLHRKILKIMPEKVDYYPILATNGKEVMVGFISFKDLDVARIDRRFRAEPRERRTVMGRPFRFCKDCPVKNKCTPDTLCPEREEYFNKKKSIITDERFCKNGKPKKHLILCQYSRYKGGYRRGVCQKELCAFYYHGKCGLSLYK